MLEQLSAFDKGFFLGLLVGEGHFGGDSVQPHINIKMHVRHEPLLRWINSIILGSKLYGPYHHAGRSYFQLMIRGKPLRNIVIPLLESLEWRSIDPHTYARFSKMKERYGLSETNLLKDVVLPGERPHKTARAMLKRTLADVLRDAEQ